MADECGDKDSFDFHQETRFSYPSIMETQIRKLKLSLEDWKEIVIYGKKVFLWEEQWHPLAITSVTTVFFMFLWLWDPTVLSVLSVLGLCYTICDYTVSTVSSVWFKSQKWNSKLEQDFEDICTTVILYKARLELTWGHYYRLKTTNRKMYFTITTLTLALLAWIGGSFNNLFLTYLLVTFLLLFPGLEHNGMFKKWSDLGNTFLLEIINRPAGISKKRD